MLDEIELLIENSSIEESDFFLSDIETFDDFESTNDICEESIQLSNTQVDTIAKIYFQQDKNHQLQIKDYLLKTLNEVRDRRQTFVICGVFYRINSFTSLLDFIEQEFNDVQEDNTEDTFLAINLFLNYIWKGFSKEQIDKLRKYVVVIINEGNNLGVDLFKYHSRTYIDVQVIVGNIKDQINRLLVRDIKQRIAGGYNPEINEDKNRVIEQINKFGFPNDLSEALEKIDTMLEASQDAFDFKGTMDLIRSFTERLFSSILATFGESGKMVREQDSEAVAKFFNDKGLISDEFKSLLISYRHFISNTASHRLKSREEDARLTRNIAIEITLYLFNRLQNN